MKRHAWVFWIAVSICGSAQTSTLGTAELPGMVVSFNEEIVKLKNENGMYLVPRSSISHKLNLVPGKIVSAYFTREDFRKLKPIRTN